MKNQNELEIPLKCKKVREEEMRKIVGGSKKKGTVINDFWNKILKP